MEVLTDKLSISQQQGRLYQQECHQQFFPLFGTCEILSETPDASFSSKHNMLTYWRKITKMTGVVQHVIQEKELRGLDFSSLNGRIIATILNYLTKVQGIEDREDRARLLQERHSERTGSMGTSHKTGDSDQTLFTQFLFLRRRKPHIGTGCPTNLQRIKMQQDKVLSNLLWVGTAFSEGLNLQTSTRSF